MSGKAKGKAKGKGRASNPKGKRRRTSNAAPAAPKRRRKRAHNPKPSRRRRRHNPIDFKGGIAKILPDLKEIGGYIGVNAAINFAVLRFGSPGAVMGGSASPTMGAAWSPRSYAVGLAAAWAASKLAGYIIGQGGRKEAAAAFTRTVFRDGIKSLAGRLFWTEGLSKSEWLRNTFGSAVQVRDDGYGNRWLTLPDGTQISMAGLVAAGPMGQLVETGQYDGMMEDALYGDDVDDVDIEGDDDGPIVAARSIDAGGYLVPGGGRRFQAPAPGDTFRQAFRRYAPI